jgi:predicted amidophosphoribosyltransferase
VCISSLSGACKPDVLILRHLEAGNPNSITVLDDVLTTGDMAGKAGISVCAKGLKNGLS